MTKSAFGSYSFQALVFNDQPTWHRTVTKTQLVMKLTIFLLTASLFSVQAASTAQGVTLTGKELSLKEVFRVIKKQTGYVLFGNEDVLAHATPVTVSVQNMPVTAFLDLVLADQPLSYVLRGKKTIIISRKSTIKSSSQVVSSDRPAAPTVQPPIRGKVIDSSGRPLSGATVAIKGKSVSTVTDETGRFTSDANEGDALVVSYVGYKTYSVIVTPALLSPNNDLVIILTPSLTKLEDVEVTSINTGYQRVRPEHSTGSFAQIRTREFESQINTDLLSGLASRVPGLMINDDVPFTSTVDGETTSRSLFNIRGISTISGNQHPLIVMDGFPTELTLDMINPNEIASVTILKDAAAATVYGVRASNGVIVIERKGPKVGKPEIQFRTNIGFTPKENYSCYDYASNASELAVNYIRAINPSIDSATYSRFFGFNGRSSANPVYYILAQQAGNIITPDQAEEALAALSSYDNTDDYERLFLRTAVTRNYNLNVSGGNANALYYITLNHNRDRDSRINNEGNRTLFSARTDLNFSKRFSLRLQTNYMESNNNGAPVPGVNTAYRFEPYEEGGNPLPVTSSSLINPYYNTTLMSRGLEDHLYYPLTDAYHISDKTHTVNNGFTADFRYDIGHGLNLSFGGIYESSRSDRQHYADEQSSEVRQRINNFITLNPDGTLNYNIPVGAYLEETTSNTATYTLRPQLNYSKKIGKRHFINAILGAEIREIVTKSSTSAYYGYNDQTLVQQPVDYTTLGSGFLSSFMGSQSLSYPFGKAYQEDRFVSAYSNIVYSFHNIYSLSGSFRIDQSNLFGTNPKYRYKPLWSLGAAWNIHKENFMKNVTWLSEWKLRIAYGFNGNVAKNSLPEVIASNYLNTRVSPAAPALGLYSLANSSLRWEQTSNFNIGMDYGFSGRINGSIDFYTKRSTDVLSNFPIDPAYGAATSFLNVATINNRGFELNLHADWISTRTFNWNTGLVLSRNTSKVLDVYRYTSDNLASELNARGYVPGYPVGALFAYRYSGLDDTGYPVVVDEKGNSYSSSSFASTITNTNGIYYYMGSSIPTVNVGLSNRIDIGNFYFFSLLGYYGGFKVQAPRIRPGDPVTGSDNYWKQPGDEKSTDVMGLEANAYSVTSYVYDNLDKYVVNGDYITLRTLTASYRFDSRKFHLLEKTGNSQIELMLQASNLFTVGLNKYNYSRATGNFYKRFLTPTYTASLLVNF